MTEEADTIETTETVEAQSETSSEFAWPDDWRSKLAGEDEGAIKRLDRYQNPAEVAKAMLKAQDHIAAGVKPLVLSDDSSEADVAEYRKAYGIPDAPDGYMDAIKDTGIVFGEQDKEMVDDFLASQHAINASPAAVGKALEWYNNLAEKQSADIAEMDKQHEFNAQEALREEWGPEYRSNMNAIENYFAQMPNMADGNPLAEAIKASRLGDGTQFMNNPAAVQWLMGVIKSENPAMGVMPAGQGDLKSVQTEIKEIEKIMRTKRSAYDKDPAMQDRLKTLYEAEEKLSSR